MVQHSNYNCKITCDDGEEHLVYGTWISNQGFANWQGYRCDAGHTRFKIDKNFNIWSGACKHDLLGNVLADWSLKSDTVCRFETCSPCIDDLIAPKHLNE